MAATIEPSAEANSSRAVGACERVAGKSTFDTVASEAVRKRKRMGELGGEINNA